MGIIIIKQNKENNMSILKQTLRATLALPLLSIALLADNNTTSEDVQDMSDPLAVYTQAGLGITDRGINVKIGQAYDTGDPKTMGMNIIEIKGIFGESLGWRDYEDAGYGAVRNAVEVMRFRNFSVNLENGRGSQIDVFYDLHDDNGNVSYSLIQALPPFAGFSLYPLAGLGVQITNNALQSDGSIREGYSIPGTFALLGMYGKYAVTDQIWINYNPIWLTTLSGSDLYKDNAYGPDNSSILLHEAAISYQITPVMNVRYFANWNQYNNFADGEHRIELNYQF